MTLRQRNHQDVEPQSVESLGQLSALGAAGDQLLNHMEHRR
jgi:hypothetical protein